MVANLENKLLGDKKTSPKTKTADPSVFPGTSIKVTDAVETKAPIEPPVKPESLMGFTHLDPNDIYLHGLDPLPEGFDEKVLEAFADPFRLAYDDSNPGYSAYKEVLKGWGQVKKPASIVPVKSIDGTKTIFAANDGRQTTKLARDLGFKTMPVLSSNETDAKEIALYTVSSNTGIPDSILVKAAKVQALVDLKIPQRTIAPRFGESQSTINNWLKLNKASDYLKQLIVNGEHGIKPGVAWTTAATMISKKWTDEQIKQAIEPELVAGEGEEGDEGEGGEGTEGEGEAQAAPARITATSIFGSFKDDLLAVVNGKGFALPETLNKATPVEMFIMGIELAFAKKTDALAEDFKKSLNEKMARSRKSRENAAKRAAEKASKGE